MSKVLQFFYIYCLPCFVYFSVFLVDIKINPSHYKDEVNYQLYQLFLIPKTNKERFPLEINKIIQNRCRFDTPKCFIDFYQFTLPIDKNHLIFTDFTGTDFYQLTTPGV